MRNIQLREIETYRTQNGREPFTEWFNTIRHVRTQTRIRRRLDRLEKGNLGDCGSVGSGIFELRLHLDQVIASTLVKWIEQSFFCSVVGISQRRHEILREQKHIG